MTDKKNGLELLGAAIDKEIQEDIARREQLDVEIPQELHEKMMSFARELDKKRIAKEKKKKQRRMMQAAAVFAVVLIAGNFIALETSQAYRARFMSLFKDDVSVTIRTEDEYDLIGDWEDYWYPATLPDTFVLQGAERNNNMSLMLFIDVTNDIELRVFEYALGRNIVVDSESLLQERLEIENYSGYAFYDEKQSIYYAVWNTDKKVISLELSGNATLQDVKKIAEGAKHIK